jgi:hypothetical protein
VKASVLLFLKKVYGKTIPRNIRKKLNLGGKLRIDEYIAKRLPEYGYGYLEPTHIKMKLCSRDPVQRGICLTGAQDWTGLQFKTGPVYSSRLDRSTFLDWYRSTFLDWTGLRF